MKDRKYYIIILSVLASLFSMDVKSQEVLDYGRIEAEFKADTARIEQIYRNDTDYTTMGMIAANVRLREDYDKLLNKYYQKLSAYLNEDEKKVLRASQRNWIKFRDSEYELISALRGKAYEEAGGGTIWGIVYSGRMTEVTRQRVFELYSFLMFADLGGR